MTFTKNLPTVPGLYNHYRVDVAGTVREQQLFVGYTNATAPKLQGTKPNPYMPYSLKCCSPDEYLHTERLTPKEWGGWWSKANNSIFQGGEHE